MTDSVPGPGDQHEDNAKDARIQVLTAEVRTLVVGSRQVTLSVYGQLDFVEPPEIEPFGRVAPKDAYYWRTYVVGRSRADGALVGSHTFSKKGIEELAKRGTVFDGRNRSVPRSWPSDQSARDKFWQLACEWAELPLIVLAGLR